MQTFHFMSVYWELVGIDLKVDFQTELLELYAYSFF